MLKKWEFFININLNLSKDWLHAHLKYIYIETWIPILIFIYKLSSYGHIVVYLIIRIKKSKQHDYLKNWINSLFEFWLQVRYLFKLSDISILALTLI